VWSRGAHASTRDSVMGPVSADGSPLLE
jgi:hypothetical protein